jgi:hypothetical protein
VLDVFGFAATGSTSTQATIEEAAFFVNPGNGIEGERVGTGLEVVSFSNNPVDARLETETTEALRGGLCYNQFVSFS